MNLRNCLAFPAAPCTVAQIVVVHLDQGFITVLNSENGIPDVTGCHPNATATGIFYSGPDQALLDTEDKFTRVVAYQPLAQGGLSSAPISGTATPRHPSLQPQQHRPWRGTGLSGQHDVAAAQATAGYSGLFQAVGGAMSMSKSSNTILGTLDTLLPSLRQTILRGGVLGQGQPRDAYAYPTAQLATFHAPINTLAFTKETVAARLARKLYMIVVGNPEHVYPRKLSKR